MALKLSTPGQMACLYVQNMYFFTGKLWKARKRTVVIGGGPNHVLKQAK